MGFAQLFGGNFQSTAGIPFVGGTFYAQLSQSGSIQNYALLSAEVVSYGPLDSTGSIPQSADFKIWTNDAITPQGTSYSVWVNDITGNTVVGPYNAVISGGSPINLDTLVPTSSSVSYPGAVLLNPSGDQTISSNNLLPAAGNTTQQLGSIGAPWDIFGTQGTFSGSVIIQGTETQQISGGAEALSIQGKAATQVAAWIGVQGDTNARLLLDSSGDMEWGPGNLDQDVLLARNNQGVLALFGGNASIGDKGGNLQLWDCQPSNQGAQGHTFPGLELKGGKDTPGVIQFANPALSAADAGISRTAVGTLAIGNGVQGDFSGNLITTGITASNLTLSAEFIQTGGGTSFFDDFIASSTNASITTATTQNGDTPWNAVQIAGGTQSWTYQSGSFTNPGQIVLTTSATSGDGIAIYKGGGANNAGPLGILGNNAGWQYDCWFQLPATITNFCCRVGVAKGGQQAADAPNSGMWIEYDTSNASSNSVFEYRTVVSGTPTYTSSSVTPVASTFYHVRIRSLVAGTILFAIGSGNSALSADVSVTGDVDTTSSMLPLIQVLPRTNSAVSLTLDRISFTSATGRV